MKAAVVTPARPGSRSGNSITANRWAKMLRELGLDVSLSHEFDGGPADILIALNAFRTANSVLRFRARHPSRPLVLALTGTDLYRFAASHPEQTMGAIETADRLVVLNSRAHLALPPDQRHKCYLILESANALPRARRPSLRHFDICVVGHLRSEKDPLRAAKAVRDLPASSRLRVRHYGKAHTEEWAVAAHDEMARNPRYSWFDEVPHWQIRRVYAKSRLLVQSSKLEGGPNSVSEAIVAGLPVLGTDIDGIVGVLGEEYPGYFEVGDTTALREMLRLAEDDSSFLAELEGHISRLAPRFTPERERQCWAILLDELLES